MATKGKLNRDPNSYGKGLPELYDEVKKQRSVMATDTGLKGFDQRAKELGLSRSELFERIGRRIIKVQAESNQADS